MSYVINFFGTGIRYWICRIPIEVFQEIDLYRLKEELSWEDVFFDLHVLAKWGFDSWENIHLIHKGRGWLIGGSNYYEVRTKGKRIKKIEALELNNPYRLFDPYDKVRDETRLQIMEGFKLIVLIQLETGLVYKFKIDTPKINLEKITMHLNYQPLKENFEEEWVTSITYDGKSLVCTDEDTMVRSNKVIIYK